MLLNNLVDKHSDLAQNIPETIVTIPILVLDNSVGEYGLQKEKMILGKSPRAS